MQLIPRYNRTLILVHSRNQSVLLGFRFFKSGFSFPLYPIPCNMVTNEHALSYTTTTGLSYYKYRTYFRFNRLQIFLICFKICSLDHFTLIFVHAFLFQFLCARILKRIQQTWSPSNSKKYWTYSALIILTLQLHMIQPTTLMHQESSSLEAPRAVYTKQYNEFPGFNGVRIISSCCAILLMFGNQFLI